MPADLLLVRHGESEGNVAVKASKRGDDSHMNEQFLSQHSSRWRLSELGCEQATETGLWLRENFPQGFHRYYVSEYTRALETAGLLRLVNSEWLISPYLRERWRGDLDRLPSAVSEELYRQSFLDKETAPYYWRPPNGESLADVSARLRIIIDTLHRECADKSVIMVCHGEVMEALNLELQHLGEHQYIEWIRAQKSDSNLRLRNCQIFHYTRKAQPDNPESKLEPYLAWFRSSCPANGYIGSWQKIEHKKYSSQQLLELSAMSPKLFG